MAGNEVKSFHIHASGTITSGRGRMKGFIVNHATGSTGETVIYDNTSASGTVLLELDETGQGLFGMEIPGDGILFETGVYVSLAINTTLTLFIQQ
mgnify:CR=1 FL=1